MTDAHPSANGHVPDEESVRRVAPDLDGTSGYGDVAAGEFRGLPRADGANAGPGWPGVVRPAGWFLSATGEAAPPVRHGTEPARADGGGHPPAEARPDGFPGPAGGQLAGYQQADYRPAGYDDDNGDSWYEDPQPTGTHPSLQPGSWQQGPREAGSWQAAPPRPAGQQVPAATAPGPVIGPTAALRGRAGGPGFVVPPGAVPGLYDPANRSGWQLSHGVWQDSGIGWAPMMAEPEPAAAWDEYPRGGLPGQPWPADARGQGQVRPPSAFAAPPPPAFAASAQPAAFAPPGPRAFAPSPAPAFAAMPLGAPTMADAPTRDDTPVRDYTPVRDDTPTRDDAPALPMRSRLGEWAEPDELYQAWQGSVRKAVGRPRTARHHHAWQLVRVGVPAAVIVTVGAGAVMMLTGKTNEMLNTSANQGSTGSATPGASSAALTGGTFAGYPGQQGTVTVSSIAAGGGTRLAVGSADGHPAIWHRAADGTWTLVSATQPVVYQRPGIDQLTSVAYGPAGWIAVGDTVSGGDQQPIILTSADGITWQELGDQAAFTAPGSYVLGVTAGKNGYVVVGKQMTGGRLFAAMWWSADLRTWVQANNGGLDGRLKSSAAYAVAATATGFIAAGTHGAGQAVWTSADGRNWNIADVPVPTGAASGLLSLIAVNGSRIAAAGYAVTGAGNVPIVVVSADGGQHWRQIVLAAPGGVGAVTALTAAGGGFTAAGQTGQAGSAGRHTVTWTSPDGLTWSTAAPADANVGRITALAAAGDAGTVTGTAQQGTAASAVTVPSP
jgi:hypothetical protein